MPLDILWKGILIIGIFIFAQIIITRAVSSISPGDKKDENEETTTSGNSDEERRS